ncbi:MAG: YwiC-like family protein [Betaproteobacteria bacterium]
MLPREHGAYGQLLFPLVTALAVGRPGAAALALAASAIAIFLSHESLLVLIGQRGQRAAREHGAVARRWFVGLASIGAAFGLVALDRMPPQARLMLLVPVALAALLGAWIARRREHSTSGEIVSALGLSSLSLPIAVSAGASLAAALTCAIVFGIAFLVATVSVRAMILWARRAAGWPTRVVAALLAAAGVAALWALAQRGVTSPAGPWAALPVCGVGFAIAAAAPSPRYVRTIGWVLVGATAVTAVILIIGM